MISSFAKRLRQGLQIRDGDAVSHHPVVMRHCGPGPAGLRVYNFLGGRLAGQITSRVRRRFSAREVNRTLEGLQLRGRNLGFVVK